MIQKDTEETRIEAARIIARGGIISYRTDTFYGLGADPLNRDAVRKLRELKGREENKPILILISDLSDLDRFTDQSDYFRLIAPGHWPAPLTLIGIAHPELPEEITAGTNSIGLRLPDDENVRALVRECGGGLTATSANLAGRAPARSAAEVQNYFPSGIDLIIDGGEVVIDHPSTVVDLSGEKPRIIREGAIPRAVLDDFLKN